MDLGVAELPEWDEEGTSREMTIASAPCEERLLIAMRMRDTPYKRALQRLPLGSALTADEPAGAFTLHSERGRAVVLLAGGIGVTPFRSMLRQALQDGLPSRTYLFYSNRRPEEAVFLDELGGWATQQPGFVYVPTMTQMWQSPRVWTGETEHIGPEMIRRYVGDLTGPIYYLAGPPAMVQGVTQALMEAGVSRGDVNADPFDGY